MIFTKLELDVMQQSELIEGTQTAVKYNFPSVVVHQGLVDDATDARARIRGRFKIITAVDWPSTNQRKHDAFGVSKFRGLSVAAVAADGFEVFLSGVKGSNETKNEVSEITKFVSDYIGELIEVRFVIGASIRDSATISAICDGLKEIKTKFMLRTDHQLKLQIGKANTDIHNNMIKRINNVVCVPIKVSGNINNMKAVTGCDGVERFAVNLAQAKTIISEFHQQPTELKDILQAIDDKV